MRHITVRNVPDDVAKALERRRRESGRSLNQTVIDLLRIGLGLPLHRDHDNGLGSLAGGWTDEDLEEFQRVTRPFEEVDAEMWR